MSQKDSAALQTDQFSSREPHSRTPVDDVDAKVMLLLKQLYGGEMTSVEFVDVVERLSTSSVDEKVVFERLIQLISEEIRYVSKYTSNDMRITAEVVGIMLGRGLLVKVGPREMPTSGGPIVTPFAVVIRGTVEAIRRPPTSRLFRFGMIIVEQILPKIIKWPQMCGTILQSPSLKSTYPLYFEYIEKVTQFIPEEKRGLPLLDEQEYSKLMNEKGQLITKTLMPALYPPPITERDEQEQHQSRISAFKRGESVPGVKSVAVFSNPTAPVAVDPSLPAINAVVSTTTLVPPVVSSTAPINVDDLLNDPSLLDGIEVPPEWFQEQTATLFNLLCTSNVEEKIKESRPVMEKNKQFVQWFSFYLIKNRVSKETNQHGVYLQFIDGLMVGGGGLSKLLDQVTIATFSCLKVLLSALSNYSVDSVLNSGTYRTVLKNLGSWLGQTTIARNKAIKVKDLDLKQLILESYERGQLTTTLPLVGRIMNSVLDSKVFRPPNPWTTGILSLLAELHELPLLKTPLSFEIEILFKKLEIGFGEMKKEGKLLSSRKRPEDSQDFSKPIISSPAATNVPTALLAKPTSAPSPVLADRPLPTANPAVSPSMAQLTQQLKQLSAVTAVPTANWGKAPSSGGAPPPPPPPPPGVDFGASPVVPGSAAPPLGVPLHLLPNLVSIPQSVALFQIQPKLRPLVPLAVERAIREIVAAVSERSVTISCLAAREIVLKDFSTEADETVLRKAAQLMVGCLSGSLALTTCREPFRAALGNHLKSMLQPGGVSADVSAEQLTLIEQVVQVVTAENIDLGCVLIERSVYERSIREINETISIAVQARRLHREQQAILSNLPTGGMYQPARFVDPVFDNAWATANLPLAFRNQRQTGSIGVYKEYAELIVRLESATAGNAPLNFTNVLGTHPVLGVIGPLSPSSPMGGVVPPPPRPPPPPPSVGPSPPPPATGLPSLNQVQQLLQSIRVQAESYRGDDLGEVKSLLEKMLPELAQKLALSESVLTLPEIVENQPFQLDAYYGLISLGFGAEWLEFLRRIQMILVRDPTIALPLVWAVTREISDRFGNFATVSVPIELPPSVTRLSDRLSLGCSVTEEHLFVEISFAVLGIVPSVLGVDPEIVNRVVHTPVMAWVMEMLFSKLNETCSDKVKSAMLTILLAALRYNVVKETEMDRMLARLLTDHRTISTTGFVVYLLQVFTCRMRMSPLQHWPITTEVIYKMLQRVTAAGPLIPPNEKGLAAQLDSFSREMKAVANVNADRINAYRQLHCLSTRPPEPLPWDIIMNQAVLVGAKDRHLSALSVDNMKPNTLLYRSIAADVLANNFTSWTEIPPQYMQTAIWGRLKAEGKLELDLPAAPGPMHQQLPEWVEIFFQSVLDPLSSDSAAVDSAIALVMAVCARTDIIGDKGGQLAPQDLRPLDILRGKYIRKLWDVVARLVLESCEKGLLSTQKIFSRILALTLQDALKMRPDTASFTNAVLSHFGKTLFVLNPSKVPQFTYGWFDLVANRNFMPPVLGLKGQRGWLAYSQLIGEGLRFVADTVDETVAAGTTSIPSSVSHLITGTERILSVLNANFPEFLALYWMDLVDALGTSSYTMHCRNLILATIPREDAVIDPFGGNSIKLEPITSAERNGVDYIQLVETSGVKLAVSQYMTAAGLNGGVVAKSEQPVAIGNALNAVKQILFGKQLEGGNIKLIHSFLLYVGIKLPSLGKPVPVSLDIFMDLVNLVNANGGSYRLISSMVDMLRAPGPQTSLFAISLLFIFAESQQSVKEEITRVLLERLLVDQPHPWGLLATFSELMKNARFAFWTQPFVSGNASVEKLIKSVAVMCFDKPLVEQPEQAPSIPPTAPATIAVGPSALLQQIVEQQRNKRAAAVPGS